MLWLVFVTIKRMNLDDNNIEGRRQFRIDSGGSISFFLKKKKRKRDDSMGITIFKD